MGKIKEEGRETMKIKKGFTLVELLAVIVVLGIIALVITPVILEMIKTAENGTAESAMLGYVRAVEKYYVDSLEEGKLLEDNRTYSVDELKKSIKTTGAQPTSGEIFINDSGLVGTSRVCINNKYVDYDGTNAIVNKEKNCKELLYSTLADTLRVACSKNNTNGLVEDDNGVCYYKGTSSQITSNYYSYGGVLWRIVAINQDRSIVLITDATLKTTNFGSYTSETDNCIKNGSCSKLEDSNVSSWMNNTFLPSLTTRNGILTKSYDRKYYNGSEVVNGSFKGVVTLLSELQYRNAGAADSYLNKNESLWLADIYSSSYVRTIESDGSISLRAPGNTLGVRPIITITNSSADGDGTKENPYQVK